MTYPHSKPETIADGLVHAAGLLLAIPASILLVRYGVQVGAELASIYLYVGCMIFSFIASAAYNLTPLDHLRPFLNRVDHAAIYFKIAGTYGPLVSVIDSKYAYGVLGLVWILAIFGAVSKLWFWRKKGRGSLALYLLMGWLSVLLIWPMWQHLPATALALILAGGVIYSAGAVVYSKKDMRFHTAIWHAFVLVASACFFAAITLSI